MKNSTRLDEILQQLDLLRAHIVALKISEAERNNGNRPELPWRNAGSNGNYENTNLRFNGDDR